MMLKNKIALTYLRACYGEKDIITSVATARYTRKGQKNSHIGRLSYAGRSGSASDGVETEEQAPGRVDIRVQGEWTHHFSPKWSLTANAAFATKYSPDITADVVLRHYLKSDWEIGAYVGYRWAAAYMKRYEWNDEFFTGGTGDNGYLFTGWNELKTNLLTVGGELAKTIGIVRLNTKIDMHFFNSNFYYNAQIGTKYFPANDGKTNINATASIGLAPETAVLDYALPGSFSHTNTMVGSRGQYMASPNITIGLMGTWDTYYNQTDTV